jgi:hypothetical protein
MQDHPFLGACMHLEEYKTNFSSQKVQNNSSLQQDLTVS